MLRVVIAAIAFLGYASTETTQLPVVSVPVQLASDGSIQQYEMQVYRGQSIRLSAAAFAERHQLGSDGEDQLAAAAFEAAALDSKVPHYRILLFSPQSPNHLSELLSSWTEPSAGLRQYDSTIALCPFPVHLCNETSVKCIPTTRASTMADTIESALTYAQRLLCFGNGSSREDIEITCDPPQAVLIAMALTTLPKAITLSEEDLFVSYLQAAAAATGRHAGADRPTDADEPPFVLSVGGESSDSSRVTALVFDASPKLPFQGQKSVINDGALALLWPSLASVAASSMGVREVTEHDGVVSNIFELDAKAAVWTQRLLETSLTWEDKALSRRLLGPLPSLSPPKIHAEVGVASGDTSEVVFRVVIATQGSDDTSTVGTFADVADTITLGLRSLGYDVLAPLACAPVQPHACGDFAWAPPEMGSRRLQIILLAPHNLARIVDSDSGRPVLLSTTAGADPDPRGVGIRAYLGSAVLYNFEHISAEGSGGGSTHATNEVLEVYRSFGDRIWDFSAANVAALAHIGIMAEYVPLGVAMDASTAKSDVYSSNRKGTDVLFYGTATPHRLAVLAELRVAGLRVVHANAMNRGVFGADLEALVADAKIVLSLLAFDEEEEWKITRLAPLLIKGQFVVAEVSASSKSPRRDSYAATEQAALKSGVAFATRDQLVPALKYYLTRPEHRNLVAAEGKRLFSERDEASILRDPVRKLLGGG